MAGDQDEHRRPVLGDQATVEIEGFPAGTFPTASCTLKVLDGDMKGETFTFNKPVIRIGSDVLNDIVLSDATVSRRHAELSFEDKQYRLTDLKSTNGTFVEDMKIREIYLEDGATVTFGKTPMAFSAEVHSEVIEPSDETRFGNIVGQNKGLRQIFAVLDKVAPTDLNVVITGETGTGKELFARAIHERSRRASGPLVVFDCSAFPPTLLESELFGHEKGAFSGATAQHKGVFERADNGTLFLDELGEMSVELQPKLLRAIETGEFRRVGGSRSISTDVRVIAATNREVEEMIEEGHFRSDLYYRLAQVRFRLPPLRDRLDDISLLVEAFSEALADNLPEPPPPFTPQAIEVLQTYDWPGNVRELRNVVERAVTLCDEPRVTAAYLRRELGMAPDFSVSANEADNPEISAQFEDDEGGLIPLREAKDQLVADFEKKYIEKLLDKHDHNVSAAAREAKIDRRHFYRLLKKHGLDRD